MKFLFYFLQYLIYINCAFLESTNVLKHQNQNQDENQIHIDDNPLMQEKQIKLKLNQPKEVAFKKFSKPTQKRLEPIELIIEQKKLASALGIPLPKRERIYQNVQIKQMINDLMENQEKNTPQTILKFMEFKKNLTQLDTESVQIEHVYADSEFKSKNNSFAAENAIKSEFQFENYWCSQNMNYQKIRFQEEQGEEEEEDDKQNGGGKPLEVVWAAKFKHQYRIDKVWITWAYSPGDFKINAIVDNQFIDVTQGFRNSSSDKISYVEVVELRHPISCDGIQIVMRKARYDYFGIYRVNVWIKKWIVQFDNLFQDCLSLRSNIEEEGMEVVAKNCLHTLISSDNREIWILNSDQQISPYSFPEYCLFSVENVDNDSEFDLQIQPCTFNDEKWKFNDKSQLVSQKRNKCIQYYSEVVNNQFIKVISNQNK